jgi:putative membrane protein
MTRLVVWVLVNTLAVGLAAWLFRGIAVHGATTAERVVTLLVVGVVFGLISAVVKPVVTFLSFPFVILTLGLLLLVINACMLLLTSWVAGRLGLGFHVSGFWVALFGAIVIALAEMVLHALLPDSRRRHA